MVHMTTPPRRPTARSGPLFFALVLLAGVWVPRSAPATDFLLGDTVRAGIYVDPPVTISESYGGYSGLGVELWEIVAKRMRLNTEYVVFDTFNDMLQACGNGDIDIVIHIVGVSSKRASYLWYSFPWHMTSARIMTLESKTSSFWDEFQRFHHFRAYTIFGIIFTVMVVAMTLLRRKLEKDFPPDWKTGITLCMRDVVKALRSGKLNQTQLGWFGCLLSVLWMIFGVTASAYFTSSIASAMSSSTIQRRDLTGLAQLTGKTIAVVTGDANQQLLDDLGMRTVHYDTLDTCVQALLAGEVDAVVNTGSSLEWYDRAHPELPIRVVGDSFNPMPCGFATSRENVAFMDKVSVELIWLYETGKIEELRSRYISGR
ncbi:MAG: transporter substrate-binding domain-containing protein [Planctomycetaceae bacterium]|nr:transporter substrate-binding domain-containing protein [Planctomycetaceae bacterium]